MEKIEDLCEYYLYSVNEKKQPKRLYSCNDWDDVEAKRIENICLLCKEFYRVKNLDDIWRVMFQDYDYEYFNATQANEQRASFMSLHVYLYKKDSEEMSEEDKLQYFDDVITSKKKFYFLGDEILLYGFKEFVMFDTERDFFDYNNEKIKDEMFFIVSKNQIIENSIVIDSCIHNTDIKLTASQLGFNVN